MRRAVAGSPALRSAPRNEYLSRLEDECTSPPPHTRVRGRGRAGAIQSLHGQLPRTACQVTWVHLAWTAALNRALPWPVSLARGVSV